MKKIPQIILKAYLRRWPVHARKSQLNFFAQFSWLKAPLEEIWDELLFLEKPVAEPTATVVASESSDTQLFAHILKDRLQGNSIDGSRGRYHLEDGLLRRQGNGYLLTGVEEASNQSVVIKYYRLPVACGSPDELTAYQKQFRNIESLSHPDNQPQEDFRVIWPIDAIADFYENDGYFLVMDERNDGQTLRAWLLNERPSLSSQQVRNIIGQVLQSLMHLHHQSVQLASCRLSGLRHGNLSLDSVMLVERAGEVFFYLSDLAIWESPYLWGKPLSTKGGITDLATPETMQRDLDALSEIGWSLVQYKQENDVLRREESSFLGESSYLEESQDDALEKFLSQLGNQKFQDSTAAWQTWLKLPALKPITQGGSSREKLNLEEASRSNKNKRWLYLAGGSLLVLLAATGGWLWWRKSRPLAVTELPDYIENIQQVPSGEFSYALVGSGSWDRALKQKYFNLDLTIAGAVESQHEEFILNPVRIGCTAEDFNQAEPNCLTDDMFLEDSCLEEASCLQAVIKNVQSGSVDFAVIPLVDALELPSELGYETIAYDGITAFVPFSYSHRKAGIPQGKEGELLLSDIRESGIRELDIQELETTLYASDSVEDIELLSYKISEVFETSLPTHEILPKMLEQFEKENVNTTGFASLSSVIKQCSVYPLAISDDKEAVQPIVTHLGMPISPNSNLCDDKNLYYPNVEVFEQNRYPLAYPIVVIFPQDNRRAIAGQKFAEMMRTKQAQQLLLESGLVPIVDAYELSRLEIAHVDAVGNSKPETMETSIEISEATYVQTPAQKVPNLPLIPQSSSHPAATPDAPEADETSAIGTELLTGITPVSNE